MRKTTGSITVLSLFAAAYSQAALISINSATLSTSGAELQSTGTLQYAWNMNGNATLDPTVVQSISFYNAKPSNVTLAGLDTALADHAGTLGDYSGAMAELMGDMLANNSNGAAGTITLSGLTLDETYRLQLVHHMNIGSTGARDMLVRFGGPTGDTGGAMALGSTQGYITTIEWKADTASQIIGIYAGAGDRSIVNGLALYTVPEPSAALLGGLGLLGLLRRRR